MSDAREQLALMDALDEAVALLRVWNDWRGSGQPPTYDDTANFLARIDGSDK